MSAVAHAAPDAPKQLPALRSDLRIESVCDAGGSFPSVVICDPVRNAYFTLAWPLSGIFLVWQDTRDPAALVARLQLTYGAAVTKDDIESVAKFAAQSQLTVFDAEGGWKRFDAEKRAGRHGVFKGLVHNYLFFRIPLLHPDAMLKRLLPRLSFVFRRWFWLLVAAVAAAGLYLTTRQWNDVMAAAERIMQLQGVMIFAIAALALKGVHELGHALTTVRYGCRVPSMGVAFMLGAPVLYTDTTDSWRLSDHRQRLAIVFAGVAAESIVAAAALLMWPLLEEGLARQICFSIATTSVLMSLAVNLNPLMRFDGYFALSDYLKVPNLQARAFDLACWRLREALFGLGAPPPEVFPDRMRRILITYAAATAIYRFFLYLGIAYVVYVMAGKALGIVLGLFELVVFILMPIWRELKTWWGLRAHIAASRTSLVTFAAAAAALVAAFVPWIATVESPAVLVAASERELHVPAPALITRVAVANGAQVEQGAVLYESRSPRLEHELTKARLEARLLDIQIARLAASREEREQRLVLMSRRARAHESVRAVTKQIAELTVRAPFRGVITDQDTLVTPGTWVSESDVLARVASGSDAAVRGLVPDREFARIEHGAKGVFVPDEPTLAIQPVELGAIAPASDGRLSEPALAELYGGRVAAGEVEGVLKTGQGWVEVTFTTPAPAPTQLLRGVVRIDSAPVSPALLLWRQIARVIVREQGF